MSINKQKDEEDASSSRQLFACKRCGEEVGEGEENWCGRCPNCGGELDPIGETEEEGRYAEVWRWQCPTCGIISSRGCYEQASPEDAPVCAGVRMIKTRVCIKKEEPWPQRN